MGMRQFPISVRRLFNDIGRLYENVRRLYKNVRRLYWYDANPILGRPLLGPAIMYCTIDSTVTFFNRPSVAGAIL